MLLTAAALSLIVGRTGDAGFVAALIVINMGVSFWHEHKADTAVAALRSKLSVSVRVLRGDVWQDAPAPSLVPGDVISCTVGDLIAADAKVLESSEALVNESVVTGESLPTT